MPNFLFIAGCLVFIVLGQLLVKKRAPEFRGATAGLAYFVNPWLVCGLVSAVVAATRWIKVLQHHRLNYAYPFMRLSFLAVAPLSDFVLGEESNPQQLFGLGRVLVGIHGGSR